MAKNTADEPQALNTQPQPLKSAMVDGVFTSSTRHSIPVTWRADAPVASQEIHAEC